VWSVKSEIADLYLSGKTFATRVNGKVVLHPLTEDWTLSVQAGLAEWPRRRWRLWLGGRRCGLHLCEPIAGVRAIEEAEAALGASLSLEGWALSVRLATWSASPRPWPALATEAGLIDGLMSVVSESGGKVLSVRPWWTTRMDGDVNCAAMCDDEAITYWRMDGQGVFAAAATLWTTEEQQSATLQRLRIGGPLATWRLTMEAPPDRAQGFATSPLNEA
jgi:hypothetical protein